MFTINNRDSRPIYEQVKENLRRSIVAGAMTTDEKIPSVRDLAGQLAINPNTIQRAYRELESEGYIYSVPGKGSFVGEYAEVRDSRQKELLEQLDVLVNELSYLGCMPTDICAHIREKNSGGKSV
ncbi:MAG: GntR family transcriptional regulator [Oscillospiraceae bacterium]